MYAAEDPLAGVGAVVRPDVKGRRGGIRRAIIGLALFVPGLFLFMVAKDWLLATFGTVEDDQLTVELPGFVALIIGGPMAAGYTLFVTGLYRAVFGARGHALTPAWSLFRILFGLVVTLGMVVVGFVLFAALR